MTYFGRRVGVGDMQKYIYDFDLDDKIDPNAIADHASKHQSGGSDEMDCSGMVGRVNMVSRGYFTAHDFETEDFIADATWYELDLSAIVPAGAKFVFVKVTLIDAAADSLLNLKKNGEPVDTKNTVACRTMVADIANYIIFLVECDADRKIMYEATEVEWTGIYLNVLGWII